MVARMKLMTPLVAAIALLSGPVQPQTLLDPTRPAPAALAGAAAAASAPTDALQLQSVLLGPGRASAAVISGELVVLGGRVRDARLVRVTERGAVLKGPQGETVLALTPQATKQGHSPAAPEPNQ
jgi:MSHA biogenesis protein MshK